MSRGALSGFIDAERTSYGVRRRCRVLGVYKTAFYDWARPRRRPDRCATLAGDAVEVHSTGSLPAEKTNPSAVEAMAEVGIDITDQRPKVLTTEAVEASDVVITMGCGDACPIFPGKRYLDWALEDPAGKRGAGGRSRSGAQPPVVTARGSRCGLQRPAARPCRSSSAGSRSRPR